MNPFHEFKKSLTESDFDNGKATIHYTTHWTHEPMQKTYRNAKNMSDDELKAQHYKLFGGSVTKIERDHEYEPKAEKIHAVDKPSRLMDSKICENHDGFLAQSLADNEINASVHNGVVKVHSSDTDKARKIVSDLGFEHSVVGGLNESACGLKKTESGKLKLKLRDEINEQVHVVLVNRHTGQHVVIHSDHVVNYPPAEGWQPVSSVQVESHELAEMVMDSVNHPRFGKIEWRNEGGAHMITTKSGHTIHALGDHKNIAKKWSNLKTKINLVRESLDEILSDDKPNLTGPVHLATFKTVDAKGNSRHFHVYQKNDANWYEITGPIAMHANAAFVNGKIGDFEAETHANNIANMIGRGDHDRALEYLNKYSTMRWEPYHYAHEYSNTAVDPTVNESRARSIISSKLSSMDTMRRVRIPSAQERRAEFDKQQREKEAEQQRLAKPTLAKEETDQMKAYVNLINQDLKNSRY